jgi:hypothetical protein
VPLYNTTVDCWKTPLFALTLCHFHSVPITPKAIRHMRREKVRIFMTAAVALTFICVFSGALISHTKKLCNTRPQKNICICRDKYERFIFTHSSALNPFPLCAIFGVRKCVISEPIYEREETIM